MFTYAPSYNYSPSYSSQMYSSYYMSGSGYGSTPSYSSGGYGYSQMPYASQMPYSALFDSDAAPSYAPGATASVVDIGLYDSYFQPNQITVPVGATVRWTNRGQQRHTITSDADLWDSGELTAGASYSYTFTRAGTYPYHCTIHGKEMRGVIVVQS
jgi:plastocyanin